MRKANNSINKECHYRYGLPFSLHILKYAYKASSRSNSFSDLHSGGIIMSMISILFNVPENRNNGSKTAGKCEINRLSPQ